MQPWKCPDCKTWIAPGVTEHRCDPPSAVAGHAPWPPPRPGIWWYSQTVSAPIAPEWVTLVYGSPTLTTPLR